MLCLPSLSYLQAKMLGSSRSTCLKGGATYSLFPHISDVENKLMPTNSHGDGTSDRVWIEEEAAKKVKYIGLILVLLLGYDLRHDGHVLNYLY